MAAIAIFIAEINSNVRKCYFSFQFLLLTDF